MALEDSDLAKIGAFLKSEVSGVEERLMTALDQKIADVPAAVAASQPHEAVAGKPEVDPEAGPDYYVHLADGTVVTTKDSASTHLPGQNGEPVTVIGRYQKGQ
jgi:hypothetical protein